jgi:hypothetical protein
MSICQAAGPTNVKAGYPNLVLALDLGPHTVISARQREEMGRCMARVCVR